MRHYKIISVLILSAAFTMSGLVLAQASQEFKVTLTINDSGDQCLWAGGTEGNGDVIIDGRTGPKKIQVKLENNKGSMECKAFSGEGADQMKCSGGGKTINISNRNDAPADVRYDIWTTIDGKVVPCEPKIVNR
jgi:hypothetical protein